MEPRQAKSGAKKIPSLREKLYGKQEQISLREKLYPAPDMTTAQSTPAVGKPKGESLPSRIMRAPENAVNSVINLGRGIQDGIRDIPKFAKDLQNDPRDAFASRIPFMDSNFERDARERVLNTYPLTDKAKDLIENINMEYAGPEGFKGEGKENTTGEYRPFRGPKTLAVTKPFMPVLQKLPARLLGVVLGEEMTLENLDETVTMHELLHAHYQRRDEWGGKDFDPQTFLDDFNKVMEDGLKSRGDSGSYKYDEKRDLQLEVQAFVVDQMRFNPTYKELPWEEQVNEMYAFYGSMLGHGGLENMPEPLRKYYKDILK